MGSFDGVQVCELVGIYILCFLAKLINKNDRGLYRDDGLLKLRNVNGQQIDRMRKNIIKVFKDVGFAINVETNLKIVNFQTARSTYKIAHRNPTKSQTIYYHIQWNLPNADTVISGQWRLALMELRLNSYRKVSIKQTIIKRTIFSAPNDISHYRRSL